MFCVSFPGVHILHMFMSTINKCNIRIYWERFPTPRIQSQLFWCEKDVDVFSPKVFGVWVWFSQDLSTGWYLSSRGLNNISTTTTLYVALYVAYPSQLLQNDLLIPQMEVYQALKRSLIISYHTSTSTSRSMLEERWRCLSFRFGE